MALVIDARCISAGEGWASWFIAKRRARVFGETTAGASSRKRTYTLKNGFYRVTFPVKAYRGSLDRPIERRGLEPDVPLRHNAQDLAAGRDTVLEAAREYLSEVQDSGPYGRPALGPRRSAVRLEGIPHMTADEHNTLSAAAMLGGFGSVWVGNAETVCPVIYSFLYPLGWFQILSGSSMLLTVVACAMHKRLIGQILSAAGTAGLVTAVGLVVHGNTPTMRWLPLVTGTPFFVCAAWRVGVHWAVLRSYTARDGRR